MSVPTPTEAELNILKILWGDGPATVREVHDQLYRNTDIGYTTTLKLLQNMFAKGLVRRNEKQRQHVYTAAVSRERTLGGIVRRWVDSTFAGSPAALAMCALEGTRVSKDELNSLRELVARLEAREKTSS